MREDACTVCKLQSRDIVSRRRPVAELLDYL